LISKKIKNGKGVNLSSGKLLSFINLAKTILTIIGKKSVNVVGNSNKPEGVFARGGSRNLQIKYGFKPRIDIKEGIKMAVKYFNSNTSR
jgi:nucleoside-diphosphate-sugar epimerase